MNDKIDDIKLEYLCTILGGISTILGGLIFFGFCSWIFITGTETFVKIVIIPFLICGIVALLSGIIIFLKGLNIRKVFKKLESGDYSGIEEIEKRHKKLTKTYSYTSLLYNFGVYIFLFGFLIVFDYLAITSWSDGGDVLFLFSLIFWAVGIYMLVSNRKKNKNE